MPKVKEELRNSRLAARNALRRAGCLPFKQDSSAKWIGVERKWTGMLHARIEHDTVKGVTPRQFRWWFENIGRTTNWDGVGFTGPDVPMYQLWHHRDHISALPLSGSITESGSFSGFVEGGAARIQEVLGDYRHPINALAVCERLNDGEFTYKVRHPTGLIVRRVIHFYATAPEDKNSSAFYAETVVGVDIPVLGWFVNWAIMPFVFNKGTARRWIRHCVEEVGRSEDIIPVLYEHDVELGRAGGELKSATSASL